MPAAPLAAVFLENCSPGEPLDPAALEAALGRALTAAREAWPSVDLPPQAFAQHLARRLPDGKVLESLATLRAGDLYIARACAEGSSDAIEMFEQRFFPTVIATLRRMRLPAADQEDLLQNLRRLLYFQSDRGTSPALLDYAGVADLRGWLRVIAVRAAQRTKVRAQREASLDPDAVIEGAPGKSGPMSFVKEHYRRPVADAFRAAAALLPVEERNLLRYYYVQGLTTVELAKMQGVNSATISRRIARARERLLRQTTHELSQRLGVPQTDLTSIIREVKSRLELSLSTIL
jgi:RNA polymerase sigma-70 factor (ECF subfamily)